MATRHRLSKHFTVEEFDCHDGTRVGESHFHGLSYLCRVYLEPLRKKYGPVKIHSGYRTVTYNRKVGGAPRSYHIYTSHDGNDHAADVSCARGNPRDWHRTLAAIRATKVNKGGLGLYRTFVHVDTRDGQADWRG